MTKTINNLYEHYKNTEKKLKIVCDWDEVIQPHEPYALWNAMAEWAEKETKTKIEKLQPYEEYSRFNFWIGGDCKIEYSPYGSKLKSEWILKEILEKQIQIKNSPNFYQKAPFLTIAEDLLKLIKEGKVERLIFLSAYDRGKFPYGDERKEKIFNETFDKVGYCRTELEKERGRITLPCYLELIPFESETQGQSKADWIKENASDFDIVIDDNPNICQSLVEAGTKHNEECVNETLECEECDEYFQGKVLAPYYPAIKHHESVLLVKNEVSNLKKEKYEMWFL